MFNDTTNFKERYAQAREILLERVEKGIAYLDEYHPNWPEFMDRHQLQMNSCKRCVGGQLMGEYTNLNQEIFDTTGMTGTELGFDVSGAGPVGLGPTPVPDLIEYDILEEIWSEKIEERQCHA